ncbi:hypothetical protein CRG98_015331 [Punica granatum]|uniref:Uncharacterized protein n=1 Tax=Punica granatum TaxID=22663 RepID=A0A2I0K830_PUNGR|nr:hypothetical protein CRG98_015331 [Punica granatum]
MALPKAPGGILLQGRKEMAVLEAPGGILLQGRKEMAVLEAPGGILLQVDRPSARDHLVTRESEGHEGPLEGSDTTCHACGKKWHAWNPIMTVGTRF